VAQARRHLSGRAEETVEGIRVGAFDEAEAFRRTVAVLRRGVERKLATAGLR